MESHESDDVPLVSTGEAIAEVRRWLEVERVDPEAVFSAAGDQVIRYKDLIARGCSKVNISTALKISYMQSNLAFLRDAEAKDKWDPPSLFAYVSKAVRDMVTEHLKAFGSVGKA
jgi:fructose-bisphosphate aldolase class II